MIHTPFRTLSIVALVVILAPRLAVSQALEFGASAGVFVPARLQLIRSAPVPCETCIATDDYRTQHLGGWSVGFSATLWVMGHGGVEMSASRAWTRRSVAFRETVNGSATNSSYDWRAALTTVSVRIAVRTSKLRVPHLRFAAGYGFTYLSGDAYRTGSGAASLNGKAARSIVVAAGAAAPLGRRFLLRLEVTDRLYVVEPIPMPPSVATRTPRQHDVDLSLGLGFTP